MTDTAQYDVAVIGTGPAGKRAAIQVAKHGQRVVAIDLEQYVGGQAVHRGTIPSKTLREAVLHVTGIAQRSFYGNSYRVVADVTMEDLMQRTAQVIQAEVDVVQNAFLRNDINLVFGTARFLEPHTLAVVSKNPTVEIYAKNIILATGSRPARPDHIPFDNPRVVDSDGILTIPSIPKSLTIVGGGVIGTEYASIFATLGVQVTLIDGRKDLLEFVDEEIIEALKHRMREDGITLRLGHNVARVDFDERGRPVAVLETGAKIAGDILMYSIGRQGATEQLQLEKAGISADERGRLEVSKTYQTTVKHIYAVGDVIGQPALASTSAEQGRLAARHALGLDCPSLDDDLPIGIYTIPEISMLGKTEEDLTSAGVAYESGVARYKEIARGAIVGDDFGVLKLLFSPESRQVLGVHIFGSQASELLHIGQAVIQLGGTVDYFIETIFNYPTFAEAYRVAALNGVDKLVH
jgi:NAD(P) transhydrogenase